MPKSLVELCTEIAWSQWVALGVSGRAPEPRTAIELEAAIVFVAELAEIDPRLHDEVLDWCVRFADAFVSVSVLKHVVARFESSRFAKFAATVNAHAGTKWPTHAKPDPKFRPSKKSTCRIDRPAAVALRARKIFGINARADVLVELALHPVVPRPTWSRISSFSDLGYTKRNISNALRDLELGGVVESLERRNALEYALRVREPLFALLAPLPQQLSLAWGPRLALCAALVDLHRRLAGKSSVTAAVEIEKLLSRRELMLAAPTIDPRDPWTSVAAWLEPWLAP